jgi:hypothetical protein
MEVFGQIEKRAAMWAANPEPGAEELPAGADHRATFAMRGAVDRSKLRAIPVSGERLGDWEKAAGTKAFPGGEVARGQTPEAPETAFRSQDGISGGSPDGRVDELRRIAPSGTVKESASESLAQGAVPVDHLEAPENVAAPISGGKDSCAPQPQNGVEELVEEVEKGKPAASVVLPSLSDSAGRFALSGARAGALAGAGISSVFSGISNISAATKGKKSAAEAATDTLTDVASATVDSGVKGAVGGVLRTGALQLAENTTSAAMKSVLRSGCPAALGVTAVDMLRDGYRFAAGEIDGSEFRRQAARKSLTTGAGWVGAEIGAWIGTVVFPGVGTIVGGVLGGIISGRGAAALLS